MSYHLFLLIAKTAMRRATDLLIRYAEYHRDERNIISHFVGVPLIVFALGLLLSHPVFVAGGLALSPAWIAFVAAAAWFMTRGDVTLGLVVSLAVAGLLLLAQRAVEGSGTIGWLSWGAMTFVLGWLIQFAGHWYEGRKPAFVDDLVGLLVGPMFITAELMFLVGWNKPLQAEIECRAGPTRLRDLARIV